MRWAWLHVPVMPSRLVQHTCPLPPGLQAIRRLLSSGTTCAQLFATVHLEPCLLLADLLEQAGMRAFVGKVRRRRAGWAEGRACRLVGRCPWCHRF